MVGSFSRRAPPNFKILRIMYFGQKVSLTEETHKKSKNFGTSEIGRAKNTVIFKIFKIFKNSADYSGRKLCRTSWEGDQCEEISKILKILKIPVFFASPISDVPKILKISVFSLLASVRGT